MLRVHPIVFIKRMRRLIASIVTWLIELLFFGLGCWILLLRFEGLADRIKPHNMSIGQITIDGDDSKGYAELLRARFDHHFRRPISITKETGFLEVVSLDTPDLFQPKLIEAGLKKMTIEVSGVDVTKLIQIVNQLFKPDQWVVEGDFQSHSDRMLFVLRLRRGERLIRTWYLDRLGNPKDNKSKILEKIAKKIEKELELKWLHLTGGERRRSELKFRIHLVSGFANYRIAELENNTVNKNETICGVTFQSRIEDAEKELRGADVLHPNHYLVLQFLGLVYSEPRRKGQLSDLSIAEQYFERAISANQSDYYGHELLANILLRRVANRVLDLTVLPLINKGIESAMKATVQREMSGNSYLLQANFYTMLLTIEKDIKKRQELRKNIKQYMDQSLRFLPQAFGKKDPILSWLSIIFDILQLLSEKTEIIKTTQSKLDGDKQKTLDLVEQKKT